MRPARSSTSAASALTLWLCGCAFSTLPAFDPGYPDNDAHQQERLHEALDAGGPGTADDDDGGEWVLWREPGPEGALRFQTLTTKPRAFRLALSADTLPTRLGDVFATSEDGELVVFSSRDGRVLLRRPLPYRQLLGSARSRNRLFLTTTDGKPRPRSAVTCIELASGTTLFEHDLAGRLGAPLVRGTAVLLPWNAQHLVALDATTGRELARLRSRDDLFTWVRPSDTGVVFGDRRIYDLRRPYTGSHAESQTLTLPSMGLPGRPPPFPSSFEPEPSRRAVDGRIGVHFQLGSSPQGPPTLSAQRMYFIFFRHVFGLDADGKPRWARALDRDVVRGRAGPGGLTIITEGGDLLNLDAGTGEIRGRIALSSEVAAARLGRLRWPGSETPQPAAAAAGSNSAPPRASNNAPPREGLLQVALDPDSRLVPSRSFAVNALALHPDPEATRDLLDVYEQSSTPAPLKRRIATALLARDKGAEYLLEALFRHYDFLDQTRPPPLRVIVPPLVKMQERRAVPQLAAHLMNHETPLSDLPVLVDALAALGGRHAVPVLRQFLDLYRADTTATAEGEALVRAVVALDELGGKAQHAHMQQLADDQRTVPQVRHALAKTLALPEVAPVAADTPVVPGPIAATPRDAPLRLEQRQINAAFAGLTDDLRACILDELGRTPNLAQIRIAFVIGQRGTTTTRSYVPNTPEFVACLDPKVAVLRFPRTQTNRQLGHFTVGLQTGGQPPVARHPARGGHIGEQPGSPQDRWWSLYERPASPEVPIGPPWWRAQNPLVFDVTQAFRRAGRPAQMPASQAAGATAGAASQPAPDAQTKEPTVTPTSAPTEDAPAAPGEPDAWWAPTLDVPGGSNDPP